MEPSLKKLEWEHLELFFRNELRKFLEVQAKPYNHCLDAIVVEAWACRDGMNWPNDVVLPSCVCGDGLPGAC